MSTVSLRENKQSHEPLDTDSIRSFQQNLSQYTFSPSNASGPRRYNVPKREHGSVSSSRVERRRVSDDDEERASPCSSHLLKKPGKKPKIKQSPRGYASPERYSHLHHINDCLLEGLDIVFCGINPGQRSAETGHHFAHPSNHFWKCLHLSGLTPERIHPSEDYTLPERFSLGLTNMVDRPTAEANELKDSEMTASIPIFFQKIAQYRPKIVAYVGLHTGRLVHNYVLKIAPFHLSSEVTPKWVSSLAQRDNGRKDFGPGLQCYKIVYTEHQPGGK